MAIVVRSERNFKLVQDSSGKIGPGEYVKDNLKSLEEKPPQNPAPFNTKSQRYMQFSEKKNNDVGPGSYYHAKQRSFIRKSFNRQHNNLKIINKKDMYNLALFKVVNGKKLIKMKDQQSLVIDKENKDQVFNVNNSNNYSGNTSVELRTSSPKLFYKILPTTLTKNRINSIPSKEHYLGYDFDEHGQPVIIDVNSKENNKEGENKRSERKINSLDWSKMSKKDISVHEPTTKDNTLINNSSKHFTNNETSQELNRFSNDNYSTTSNYVMNRQISTLDSQILNKNRKNSGNNKYIFNVNEPITYFTNTNTNSEFVTDKNGPAIYKSISDEFFNKKTNPIRGNIYKTTNQLKRENKISVEDYVYYNLFKDEPGPGYYQERSDFDKYYFMQNKYQNFNFGSKAKRDNKVYISSDNVNVGPGKYFHETKNIKARPGFFPFSKKENPVNTKKFEQQIIDQNRGPGKYDFKSQFDKTQIYYSGPLEKRFFNNYKGSNLGPGEYLPLEDWNKNDNTVETETLYLNNSIIQKGENKVEHKDDKGRQSYIVIKDTPGVGDYNPHIISSIKYGIISKDNKVSNIIAPFSCGEKKFVKKSSSTPDIVGPGSYFPSIKNRNILFKGENNKIGHNIFKSPTSLNDNIKVLYKKMKSNEASQVGPGSYELQKFNDWHIKSFNSLYI